MTRRPLPKRFGEHLKFDRRKNIDIKIKCLAENCLEYYPWRVKQRGYNRRTDFVMIDTIAHVDYFEQVINIGNENPNALSMRLEDDVSYNDYYEDINYLIGLITHETIHYVIYSIEDHKMAYNYAACLDNADHQDGLANMSFMEYDQNI